MHLGIASRRTFQNFQHEPSRKLQLHQLSKTAFRYAKIIALHFYPKSYAQAWLLHTVVIAFSLLAGMRISWIVSLQTLCAQLVKETGWNPWCCLLATGLCDDWMYTWRLRYFWETLLSLLRNHDCSILERLDRSNLWTIRIFFWIAAVWMTCKSSKDRC